MPAENNKPVIKLSQPQADFVRNLIIRNDTLVRTLLKSTLGDLYGSLGDECIGELHLLACEKAAELMEHPNPDGWLIKACKLKGLEQRRKATAVRTVPLAEINELPACGAADDSARLAAVLERLGAMEDTDLLTPRERQIYCLIYIKDKTVEQTAKLLGISEKTVHNTRLNMIKKVKKFISENIL